MGGYHPTLDEAPTNSMFLRAGGVTPRRRSTADMSQTITQLASAMLPATPSSSTAHSCLSPARKIENKSKCYKQLAELKNLNQSGILNDEEYDSERQAIMEVLKSIGGRN